MAQEFIKEWQGYANVEFSRGIAGYARKSGYLSAGVAASYGMLINDHYYIALGIKPNYIFSDGDFDGFFLPTYAEFKYKTSVNEKLLWIKEVFMRILVVGLIIRGGNLVSV